MSSNIYMFWIKMEIISERVTGLESFALCPQKYNKVPFDGSNSQTIVTVTIWDILHLAHNYPTIAQILADEFFDIDVPKLLWKRDNLLKKQMDWMINLARDWIREFEKNDKRFEVKTTMMIEDVLVSGTYDCLVEESDWFHLFDYKTTGNINYYANWLEKLQPIIYSYFIMSRYKLKELKFSYQLYIKWKDNWKVSTIRKTKMMYRWKQNKLNQIDYIDDIEWKAKQLARSFRQAKETWFFPPKNTNSDGSPLSACRYCPLSNATKAWILWQDVCIFYRDQSSIFSWWGIDFEI